MARMPRVTYEAAEVVWITIRGQRRAGCDRYTVPDDGGLVGRFLAWLGQQDFFRAVPGGYSGAGGYAGAFWPEDAKKVIVWLKENGCVEK